jgi:pyruvate dehydrogenase E2 component (dihydrolipoamide acetyltransferase)
MSVQIEMPQLSADGESATLASWLVSVGDTVEAGDVIAELETDKSTLELEAPASGTITHLNVAAGSEDIEPGAILGTIDRGASAAADEADTKGATPEAGASTAPAVPSVPPPAVDAAVSTQGADGEPRSTPLARRAAEANEVDLAVLTGSGPGGRIVEADVLHVAEGGSDVPEGGSDALEEGSRAGDASAASAKPDLPLDILPTGASADQVAAIPAGASSVGAGSDTQGQGFRATRLSAMRKTIARRMTESKQQIPHFYLQMSVAMDEVIAVRARLNSGLEEEGRGVKISVNDFILRASALALRDVPDANVQFAGDVMHVFDRVDVSVAVATEGGLVTPVVRDADRKGLTTLAEEVKSLATQARDGSLTPDQYQGGTFTISNLGMYGVDTVFPILNPPEACILGVGAADEQVVVRAGEIAIGRVAVLTLAADHRAVDGAVGAQLLSAIRSRLEDPMGMML